jgi:hypothetical protein
MLGFVLVSGISGLEVGFFLRVPDLTLIRVQCLRTLTQAMTKPTVTFRPTTAQRQWLDRQRVDRGIPVTTLIQLALEQAMAADSQQPRQANDNR